MEGTEPNWMAWQVWRLIECLLFASRDVAQKGYCGLVTPEISVDDIGVGGGTWSKSWRTR